MKLDERFSFSDGVRGAIALFALAFFSGRLLNPSMPHRVAILVLSGSIIVVCLGTAKNRALLIVGMLGAIVLRVAVGVGLALARSLQN